MLPIYLHNDTASELLVDVRSHVGSALFEMRPNDIMSHSNYFPGIKFVLVWVPNHPTLGPNTPVSCHAIDAQPGHIYRVAPNGIPVAEPIEADPGKPFSEEEASKKVTGEHVLF
jgi:hypothetical protein